MVERFGLRLPRHGDWAEPRSLALGEIRPTNRAPVIMANGEAAFLPWGLAVSWQPSPLINARAETLDAKPTFKPLLGQRCLVPATAYFEWRKDGRNKIKTRISVAGEPGFAMAGLIGGDRFTVVTCAPTEVIAHIHDRMPVILDAKDGATWLDASAPFASVKPLLKSYAGALAWEEPVQRPAQGRLFG